MTAPFRFTWFIRESKVELKFPVVVADMLEALLIGFEANWPRVVESLKTAF